MGMPLSNKLAVVGGQVSSLSTNLATSQASMLSFSLQAQRLQSAQTQLYDLLAKFTELNPSVRAKRQEIQDLQRELASAPTNADFSGMTQGALPKASGDGPNPELELLQIKMRTLEDSRQDLVKRQREAELYMSNPPGNCSGFCDSETYRRSKPIIGA